MKLSETPNVCAWSALCVHSFIPACRMKTAVNYPATKTVFGKNILKSGGSTTFQPFKYSTTITLQTLYSSAFRAKGEGSGSRNEKLWVSLSYTFNNYKLLQARVPDSEVPKLAINGVFPNENTVKNRTYPFISEVHVAIRSDLAHNTMAYKLYEWLISGNAESTIKECGFVTK